VERAFAQAALKFNAKAGPYPAIPTGSCAIDFGIKRGILSARAHGCQVSVSCRLTAALEARCWPWPFEGVFLSNGPGDPAAVTAGIQAGSEGLLGAGDLPTFGICLAIRFFGLGLGGQAPTS